jgi:predicted aspartyl protease
MPGADVVLPQLRIGDTRADDLRVVATDLSATVASLGLDRLDGIVGMDVLGRTSFAIDYARRRLSFGARTRTRHRIPLGPDPVFPVVNVDIAGIPAELIVDTGASHVVLFLPAGDRTFERVGTIAASMLGGSAAIQGLLLPELRLGAFRMRDLPAVIAEAPVPTRPVKGLLAPTVLGSTFLQFDFSRQELGWRP